MASLCYPNSKLFASNDAAASEPAFSPKTDHVIPTEMSLVWALHSSGLSSIKSDRVAQIVRQVHFLERELGAKDPERNGAWLDGVHWTYQRYRDLHEYFPHWPSERMVRDVVKSAEGLGLLISRKWNYFKLYRVDYAGLRTLCHQTGVEPPAWAFDEPEAEGVQLDIFVEDDLAQAVEEAALVEKPRVTSDVTLDCHETSLQTDTGRHPASLYTETNIQREQTENPPPPGGGGGRLTEEFMSVLEDGLRRPRWELRNVERAIDVWTSERGVAVAPEWADELLDKIEEIAPASPVGLAVSIVRDWTHESWGLDLGQPPERAEEDPDYKKSDLCEHIDAETGERCEEKWTNNMYGWFCSDHYREAAKETA